MMKLCVRAFNWQFSCAGLKKEEEKVKELIYKIGMEATKNIQDARAHKLYPTKTISGMCRSSTCVWTVAENFTGVEADIVIVTGVNLSSNTDITK